MLENNNLVIVGRIIGSYGVKGELRIKSFCEQPSSIENYNPVLVENCKEYHEIKLVSKINDGYRALLSSITNREEAKLLRGKNIYTARKNLPILSEEEYYFSDLIGLDVKDDMDNLVGRVKNVEDHGAGTYLEIQSLEELRTFLVPFTKAFCPELSLKHKQLKVTMRGIIEKTSNEPGI